MDDEAPARAVVGQLDEPLSHASVRRGPLVARGWAYGTSSPVSRVEIQVDGHPPVRAGMARPRPDVADLLGNPDAELSGFEARIDLGRLVPLGDRALVMARAELLDGALVDVAGMEIRVLPIERPAPNTDADVARAIPLRRSLRQSLRRVRRVRVLCAARSLDHGGSQLWLKAFVRHLVEGGSFDVTVASPSEGPLRNDLEPAGAAIEITTPVPLDDIDAYEAAVCRLADWSDDRFDVVLATTLTSFPTVEAAARSGIPSVWRIGEIEPLATVAGWLGATLHPDVERRGRRAFEIASVVLFNSGAARRRHRDDGATGNLAVLESGTDVADAEAYTAANGRSECRRRLGVVDESRLLVCAGTLWPVKGQALLVQALQRVHRDHPELAVILAGQDHGAYGGALSRFARRHGLGSNLRLLPFQADVRPLLRAADVVVCPSESESMPAAVLEAMAFGLPVLGCRVGGVLELVEPGVTGWLCEPNDVTSMVTALAQVATASADDLARMGDAGAQRVRSSHDRADEHRRLDRVLRDLARRVRPDKLQLEQPIPKDRRPTRRESEE